jgi:small-conductance mechanosensitive channel
LKVWDIFKEHNIEIPFPQRDLHIRSSEVLTVKRKAPDPE